MISRETEKKVDELLAEYLAAPINGPRRQALTYKILNVLYSRPEKAVHVPEVISGY